MKTCWTSATVALVLCAGLSHTLPQDDGHESKGGGPASRDFSRLPTTLATLPNDSEGLAVDADRRTRTGRGEDLVLREPVGGAGLALG